jgi:Protein of unknown function (DUF3126)
MKPSEISKLQGYLRRVYGNNAIGVRARPKSNDKADVFVGDTALAYISVDDEDGDTCYQFNWEIKEKPQPLGTIELARIQGILREKLGSKNLTVRGRGKIKDSCEVFVGDESYAIISVDKSSYQFQMAILDIDLEEIED